MFTPRFASSAAKIRRADEHLQAFKHELWSWHGRNPYTTIKKRNADLTQVSEILKVLDEPPLQRWSLNGGDCIHNLRSSLDHAVFSVADETIADPQKLAFPISNTPEGFQGQLARGRLKGVPNAIQAEIERVQPYNRAHELLPPLLALLRDLDDRDRHKLLNVTMATTTRLEVYNFTTTAGVGRPSYVIEEGSLRDGSPLVIITFDRPSPKAEYDFKAEIDISIEHAPGPNGMAFTPLIGLLREFRAEVESIIESIAKLI